MQNQRMINKVKLINIILSLSYLLFFAWLSFIYIELGAIALIACGIIAIALEATLIYELKPYKRELKQFIHWEKIGF